MIILIILTNDQLKRLRDRDPEIFEMLFKEYYNKIYNYLLIKVNGNKESAEDIVSETFCSALKSAPKFQDKNKVQSWIFQIARRRFYDFLRKKYRCKDTEKVIRDQILSTEDTDDQAVQKEKTLLLQVALDNLTEEYKTLLILKYIKKLSQKEIAEKLGKTRSSVENKLFRARKVLNKEVKKLMKVL